MSNSSQWTGQGQGLRLWLCSCALSHGGVGRQETARQPGRHQGNRRSHSNSMAKYSYLPTCMYVCVCMYIYLLRVPDSTPDSQDVVASSSPPVLFPIYPGRVPISLRGLHNVASAVPGVRGPERGREAGWGATSTALQPILA